MQRPHQLTSTHWATYLCQFEALTCLNKWTEEDKCFSLILALKGPATELVQKMPSDSQNTYAEFTNALELQYNEERLCDVYHVPLKARQHD